MTSGLTTNDLFAVTRREADKIDLRPIRDVSPAGFYRCLRSADDPPSGTMVAALRAGYPKYRNAACATHVPVSRPIQRSLRNALVIGIDVHLRSLLGVTSRFGNVQRIAMRPRNAQDACSPQVPSPPRGPERARGQPIGLCRSGTGQPSTRRPMIEIEFAS